MVPKNPATRARINRNGSDSSGSEISCDTGPDRVTRIYHIKSSTGMWPGEATSWTRPTFMVTATRRPSLGLGWRGQFFKERVSNVNSSSVSSKCHERLSRTNCRKDTNYSLGQGSAGLLLSECLLCGCTNFLHAHFDAVVLHRIVVPGFLVSS